MSAIPSPGEACRGIVINKRNNTNTTGLITFLCIKRTKSLHAYTGPDSGTPTAGKPAALLKPPEVYNKSGSLRKAPIHPPSGDGGYLSGVSMD
jgi:hypothetical protein